MMSPAPPPRRAAGISMGADDLTFDFRQHPDGTWIGTSNHDDEPLNGAALNGLSIRLEPAGNGNGRKTWHVEIEGVPTATTDDVAGNKPTPGRPLCRRC